MPRSFWAGQWLSPSRAPPVADEFVVLLQADFVTHDLSSLRISMTHKRERFLADLWPKGLDRVKGAVETRRGR
jgi:hypothetical protein